MLLKGLEHPPGPGPVVVLVVARIGARIVPVVSGVVLGNVLVLGLVVVAVVVVVVDGSSCRRRIVLGHLKIGIDIQIYT